MLVSPYHSDSICQIQPKYWEGIAVQRHDDQRGHCGFFSNNKPLDHTKIIFILWLVLYVPDIPCYIPLTDQNVNQNWKIFINTLTLFQSVYKIYIIPNITKATAPVHSIRYTGIQVYRYTFSVYTHCVLHNSCLQEDSVAVSIFLVISVEIDKYWDSETSRLYTWARKKFDPKKLIWQTR